MKSKGPANKFQNDSTTLMLGLAWLNCATLFPSIVLYFLLSAARLAKVINSKKRKYYNKYFPVFSSSVYLRTQKPGKHAYTWSGVPVTVTAISKTTANWWFSSSV